MEDYATSFLNAVEESVPDVEDRDDEGEHGADTAAKKGRGLRRGIFRAANLAGQAQDKLLEK